MSYDRKQLTLWLGAFVTSVFATFSYNTVNDTNLRIESDVHYMDDSAIDLLKWSTNTSIKCYRGIESVEQSQILQNTFSATSDVFYDPPNAMFKVNFAANTDIANAIASQKFGKAEEQVSMWCKHQTQDCKKDTSPCSTLCLAFSVFEVKNIATNNTNYYGQMCNNVSTTDPYQMLILKTDVQPVPTAPKYKVTKASHFFFGLSASRVVYNFVTMLSCTMMLC